MSRPDRDEQLHVTSAVVDPFDGPGEMRARCRVTDWSSTSLGPTSGWSWSLRTTVANMMSSRHPMFLWWGPELIQIFNDGYLPSFGSSGRDLAALGARGREHWSDIWHLIGPEVAMVMATGESSWHEDHLVPIERNGQVENVWWTYGYSPVRDDDGRVSGVLVVVQETTNHVLGLLERQRLLDVAERARDDAESARQQAIRLLALADTLASATTTSDVAAITIEHARIVLGASGIVLARLSASESHLSIVDVSDLSPSLRTEWQLIPMDAPLPLSDVARTREPIFLESRDEWRARYPHLLPIVEETGHHANAIAPLIAHGRVVGVMGAAYDAPREFAEAHRALVLAVASQCAQAFERARLFEIELEMRQELEAANRAKSEFMAVMSHELRTPLNSIGGYAELIELGIHGPVTAEQQTALSRIQMGQRHLLGLIEHVLSYSRIDAGVTKYDIEDVIVDEVLRACESVVLPHARTKQITLRIEPGDALVVARADREKVQQIVLNLLSNALKFTAPGGRVTVTSDAEIGRARMRVIDTGRGIPVDYRERVFQPFVQVDAGLSDRREGTGLGLAISRDLARGMSGDLTVESVMDEGSTFTLMLPLA